MEDTPEFLEPESADQKQERLNEELTDQICLEEITATLKKHNRFLKASVTLSEERGLSYEITISRIK
jgi:hypothetical protein